MALGHKSHHNRKHRAMGGVNEAEEDLKSKPHRWNNSQVEDEAEERKRGGRTKRKHGGDVKHVGMVHGEEAKHHAGRKPRKNGGRTGADSHPFSSARYGTEPKGHKTDSVMD